MAVSLEVLSDPLVMSETLVLDFAGGETTRGMAEAKDAFIRFAVCITLFVSVLLFDLASVKFQANMDWATVKDGAFGGFASLHGQVLAASSCRGSLVTGFSGIVLNLSTRSVEFGSEQVFAVCRVANL